jgi:hypothetical protein
MKNKLNSEKKFEILRGLIHEEKQISLKHFQVSQFEPKVLRKIKMSDSPKIRSPWMTKRIAYILPVVFFILGLGIYYLFFIPEKGNQTVSNSIHLVLNHMYQQEIQDVPRKGQPTVASTAFEISLEKILYSIQRKNTSFESLITDLASVLTVVYRGHSGDLSSPLAHKESFFYDLKRDLEGMREKNNYSDLFQGIIKSIQEETND